MMFLLGKQAMFGHEPPIILRSTSAVRWPSFDSVHARYLPPSPLPITTRSNCSVVDIVFSYGQVKRAPNCVGLHEMLDCVASARSMGRPMRRHYRRPVRGGITWNRSTCDSVFRFLRFSREIRAGPRHDDGAATQHSVAEPRIGFVRIGEWERLHVRGHPSCPCE